MVLMEALGKNRQTDVVKYMNDHCSSIMLVDEVVVQLIMNLIRSLDAKKTLDIGVFTGVSAMGAALALPEGGEVIAMDTNEEYVNIGKPFWKKAGVENKINLRIKPALETLDELLAKNKHKTFDFAFIDADKTNYLNYYERCISLIRPRGIIAVDNVLWFGKVMDDTIVDQSTNGIQAFNNFACKDDRVFTTMLPISDGVALCVVK